MKRMIAIGIATLALSGFAASATAAPWGSSDPQQVCHATKSVSNPYVLINPSAKGANKGHKSDLKLGPSVTRAATPHYTGSCTAGTGDGGGGDEGTF